MPGHPSHNVKTKLQVAHGFSAGETLHGLATRHHVSRKTVRSWVDEYEAGALDEDARAADLIQVCEARIAALGPTVKETAGGDQAKVCFRGGRTWSARAFKVNEGPEPPHFMIDKAADLRASPDGSSRCAGHAGQDPALSPSPLPASCPRACRLPGEGQRQAFGLSPGDWRNRRS